MAAGRLLLLMGLGAAVLGAGCGRRADLDTPYQAALDARQDAKANNQPLPPEPTPPPSDKPFILDKLIGR